MAALLVAGLIASPASAANNNAAGPESSGVTAGPVTSILFKEALERAQNGELVPNGALATSLQNYPLAPYLTAASLEYRLEHRPTPELDRRIRDFIQKHPTLPPAQSLRHEWLTSLIDRERWQILLANTATSPDNTTVRCGVVHARIAMGRTPAVSALDLWYAGQSQPPTCNPVFAWLERTGRLTPEVIQKRARLALIAGHAGLARYLRDKLDTGASAAERIDRWLHFASEPTQLTAARQLPPQLAVAVFKRFALIDLDAAAAALSTILNNLDPGGDARYRMRRWIALLYAENHQIVAFQWFDKLNPKRMADDEQVLGWTIRAAIYHGRWQLALKRLNALPAKLADNNNWRYWRARTLSRLGRLADARAIYRELSNKRAYYGFLAADRIGADYRLDPDPLEDKPKIQRRLLNRPGIVRARLLYEMGYVHRANREWRAALAEASKQLLAQAALLAYRWGWHSRAIITLADADYWDDLRIRYPTPYPDAVRRAARANELSPALVLAIMRSESLFQPAIRSYAGAVGLMQLLPSTARYVAGHLTGGRLAAEPLTDPGVNIPLGSRYLRYLATRWNGNPALVTASYNAGPNKITEWLPETARPADIWIANIPYASTRHYVQRVAKHMTVFQALSNRDVTRLSARLAPIKPDYSALTASR